MFVHNDHGFSISISISCAPVQDVSLTAHYTLITVLLSAFVVFEQAQMTALDYIMQARLFIEMRDKLRKWREDNYRNSEQIVDVGEELISEHASKLGDDSKFPATLPGLSSHLEPF